MNGQVFRETQKEGLFVSQEICVARFVHRQMPMRSRLRGIVVPDMNSQREGSRFADTERALIHLLKLPAVSAILSVTRIRVERGFRMLVDDANCDGVEGRGNGDSLLTVETDLDLPENNAVIQPETIGL